uniref:Uncharacterized protein n=1 Tax=Anopheles farauti TaxID=69004 RepID=A0A499FV18_9DIPT
MKKNIHFLNDLFFIYPQQLLIHMNKVEIVNNPKLVNVSACIRQYGPPGCYGRPNTMMLQTRERGVNFPFEMSPEQVSTLYYVPNLMGKYEKAFYNRTLNFCTYLRQPQSDRVLRMVYENLNRRGNLPRRCPVRAGTYSFNTSFDELQLPSFLPESRFRFDLNFHHGARYELLFESHWYGELKRTY